MSGPYDSFVRDALPPASLQPDFLFDLPQHAYPEQLNAAAELVDRAVAEGDGERIAIRNALGVTSYAELADRSGRIARLLSEREGLVPGNRVLLFGANGAMLFAAWLGILKTSGVAVTLMPLLRAGEIATILAKAEVDHAIVDARFRGEVEVAARESGRDDPAIIAFTSGTTGAPKGCIQFYRNILIPADGYARQPLGLTRDDVVASSAPIAFTFGLGAQLIFPLRARATALTLETGSPGPSRGDRVRPGDRPVHRADRLQGNAGNARTGAAGLALPVRIGGRAPSRRDVATVARCDWPGARRRHRRDRDDARFHLRHRRRHTPRRDRADSRGLSPSSPRCAAAPSPYDSHSVRTAWPSR